jgi:predicted permease
MTPGKRWIEHGSRQTNPAADMREELALHLEARARQLMERGWTADAARAEALRRIAPHSRALEASAERKARRLWTRQWLTDFMDDLHYAMRGLVRRPRFAIVAVSTIGIGIGANTAIYTAVDALLLRALPFPQPERLMDVIQSSPDDGPGQWSYPKFDFFRRHQRSFRSVAIHARGPAILTEGEPERIEIEEVSAAYLSALRVSLARGRDFPWTIDAGPGAARAAIITDALWQRRFAADPDVVGRTISIDNSPWEILGVLPPGFRGLSGRAEALLNVTARPADDLNQDWSLEFGMVGRLRDGVSPAAATDEVERLGPRIYEAFPMRAGMLTTSDRPQNWGATARPLDSIRASGRLQRALLVLFGAVMLVLLIACVNIANLLLARAVARRREMAVRLAIGGGRGRLVRFLLAESCALATLGGMVGVGIAWLGARFISAFNPRESLQVQGLEGGIGMISFEAIRFDARALVFTGMVTILVALLFGLVPALRATGGDVTADLKEGSAGSGARRAGLSRRVLVVSEVALAVVLLAGSGLMIRSLGNLLAVDPGFDASRVLTVRLTLPTGVFAPDSMPGFYDELLRSVAGVPGVEQVALADCPPLNNGCNGTIMTVADRPASATSNAMVGVHWVSPSWFQTLRVPLKRGRLFADADRLGSPRVVLVNEEAARKYFPGEDPIGKRVAIYQGGFDKGAEVVGIVGDVRYGTIDSIAQPDTYISYGQARIPRMMIFVRTAGEPLALAGAVREAARRVAPTAALYDLRTLEGRVAAAGANARFSATLLAFFAAVALSLALIGIYGVTSFVVAQRTPELGIRIALGAGQRRVLGEILGESARLAGTGLAIGVVAALAVTRVLQSLLFEVTPTDPLTYLVMGLVLVFAALAAGWFPARRATRINPTRALRGG